MYAKRFYDQMEKELKNRLKELKKELKNHPEKSNEILDEISGIKEDLESL